MLSAKEEFSPWVLRCVPSRFMHCSGTLQVTTYCGQNILSHNYRPQRSCGQGNAGWPRHRENREFGSYFFQTGKTQGNFALTQGKILRHRENIFL